MKGHGIVTGGATGIGRAIAEQFAEDGMHIWIIDSDADQGLTVQDALRVRDLRCTFVESDVAKGGSGAEVLELIPFSMGGPVTLVNNAGARSAVGLFEETEANWNHLVSVMFTATFAFSQAFILKAKNHNSVGAICNVGSIVSQLGSDQSPAYHAAKAGVAGLTKYLAVAAGRAGANVRVNAVEPGLIVQERHMDIFEAESNAAWRAMCERYQPSGVVGRDRDVANAVLWLCSDQASYVNGAVLRVDGAASVQDQFTLIKNSVEGA